jgi:RNA polymerase sigma-70 factor (ECF subfamily)
MSATSLEELAGLRPRLLMFAMRRLRDRELAEDAVQETLLAALEGIDRFAGGSSASTWVHGILRHKIVDCMRATSRETPLDAAQHGMTLDDPHQELEERRLFEAVERGLRRMPATTAQAFVLRELVGMNTDDLCKALAVSASNCWVMLHRARRRLRECPEIRGLAADAV